MGFHHLGWYDFIFLQDLYRTASANPILMKSSHFTRSLIYGGILAIVLSYVLAQYYSSSLFRLYHDWSGWRDLTGSPPNRITHSLEKISWAMIFCSGWWMLWRLDIFISTRSSNKSGIEEESTDPLPTPEDEDTGGQENAFAHQRSENFVPEDGDEETKTNNQAEKDQENREYKRVTFPTVNELEMSKILGLSRDDLDDFSKIKSTYRSAIAQYHPDKVSALGTEIREVAEKKAKEINQAYEFFRKKFKNM